MLVNSIKIGFKKGIETTWMLAKVIIPVYFVITFLQYTPVINWIADIFRPVMAIFNLPGEAAIILVLGNILNLYAAVGAINAIQLTTLEITVIAMMLSFSHSLLIETAVSKKLGISVTKVVLIRIGLAIASGVVIGRIGAIL
ncbi:nucleoside recognition domain-containing protein [Alkaliphilus peptidifermentans]|uniref:Nucleoside recognition n=1 Tax=Alkaliphilus peptidifermentans DSM 18978 TaxID=1120976 RepID=A0A1G5JRJ2_9FIRM|nr:nucleoside recognition domain-containing protein [Alkaliphilus peptidifermentans]SCY90480.1 Nucleoside recognition [Alkaliphilus peptidifermentans DSM 18978]